MNASWKLIIIARSDRARIPRSMRITRYGTCPLQTCRSNTRPVPVPTRTRARGFSIAPPDDELLIAAHSFATGLLSSKPRIQTQIRIIAIVAPSILHLVASSILTDLLAEMEHRIRMHRIILRFVSFFDAQNNVKRDALFTWNFIVSVQYQHLYSECQGFPRNRYRTLRCFSGFPSSRKKKIRVQKKKFPLRFHCSISNFINDQRNKSLPRSYCSP